jgi:hypothetical protein
MPPSDGLRGPTRATPRSLLLIAAILLVARVALGVWDHFHADERPELVTWSTPSASGVEARMRGRLLLYVFTDRAGPDSRRLSREVFAVADHARRIEGAYIPVRIEGPPSSDTPETAELRGRYRIERLPTLIVANPDGDKFERVEGYRGARELMASLSRAQLRVMGMPDMPRGVRFRFGPGGARIDSTMRNDGDSLVVPR